LLTAIRTGTTRRVVVIWPLAFKFARGDIGRRCNLFEAQLFARVSPRRQAMLCPVIWCSPLGIVLIARTAIPLTEAEMEARMASDDFPDWDYVPPDEGHPFEWKASDWGWLDGKLVALDYSAPAL